MSYGNECGTFGHLELWNFEQMYLIIAQKNKKKLQIKNFFGHFDEEIEISIYFQVNICTTNNTTSCTIIFHKCLWLRYFLSQPTENFNYFQRLDIKDDLILYTKSAWSVKFSIIFIIMKFVTIFGSSFGTILLHPVPWICFIRL